MTDSSPHVRRFLIASSLAFGLGSGALAQSDERPRPMPSHGMHRMLRHLDLSGAQRDQVFKIFHDQAPAMHERMNAARAAREELQKLAFASAFDRARARTIACPGAMALADMAAMRHQSIALLHELRRPHHV